MAKTNNKGFSFVEIVIAVAILSILLTPIIHQFGNTLETSRKAKAAQAANEKAAYEVEEFQSTSKDELDTKYASNYTAYTAKPLDMYSVTGEYIGSTTYTAYEYKLENAVIGAKKDTYKNVVVLDDIASQVRAYQGGAKQYKVMYGLTSSSLPETPGGSQPAEESKQFRAEDFTITNEGTAVKYDANKEFITAIVCTDTNRNTGLAVEYIKNPNDVNLGNMHDLDKDQVALVMGNIASYDAEAEAALFSKAMEHLKELDRNSWLQALENADGQSILTTKSDASGRLIKLYVDKIYKTENGSLTDQVDYYTVKVDVYYEFSYNLDSVDNKEFKDTIQYTIYNKQFKNLDNPPEIYIEYQPYKILDENESALKNKDIYDYSANDYILFDNYVDECRVYLYKPYRDLQNQQNFEANGKTDVEIENSYDEIKKAGFAYKTNSGDTVKIHLASTSNSRLGLKSDGSVADPSNARRVYVFTNLNVDGYDKNDKDETIVKDENGNDKKIPVQFVSDKLDGKFSSVKSDKDSNSTINSMPNVYNTEDVEGVAPVKVLYSIDEDTRKNNRMFTVTVRLTPETKGLNTIRLSGAKGAN